MRSRRVLTMAATSLLVAALGRCAGEPGEDGAQGSAGDPGADGVACYVGLSDHNGDGVVDVLDCRGDDGQDGINGSNGSNGSDGTDGVDGLVCWDLNGNGVGDLPTEDRDGDGAVDVNDCVGADGQDGQDAARATYTGWEACEACHQEQYDEVKRSGHPYKLMPVFGARPTDLQATLPVTEQPLFGNYPANPPAGYSWDDISFVIGGWGWKTRFMDLRGYIITCPPGDVDSDGDGFCDTECGGTGLSACGSSGTDFVNQWNLATDGWVTYHRGEVDRVYDCGVCHTTGYNPDIPTLDAAGQVMPGIIGSWSEPGVRCEECHGPGSLHVADPQNVHLTVERDAEACGRCHLRGEPNSINASGGFIRHHEQWEEMYSSTKHSMRCIDCHDPHQSARFADSTYNPDRGTRLSCDTCHFRQAAIQNNLARDGDSSMILQVECIDCHMPYAVKSAVGSLPDFTGDVRSHLFAINTDASAEQFNAAGTVAMPYLTLNYACRRCHPASEAARSNQINTVQTDADLELSAFGYHD